MIRLKDRLHLHGAVLLCGNVFQDILATERTKLRHTIFTRVVLLYGNTVSDPLLGQIKFLELIEKIKDAGKILPIFLRLDFGKTDSGEERDVFHFFGRQHGHIGSLSVIVTV